MRRRSRRSWSGRWFWWRGKVLFRSCCVAESSMAAGVDAIAAGDVASMACSGVEVGGATASATPRRRFLVAGRVFVTAYFLRSGTPRQKAPRPVSQVPPRDRDPAQNSALTPALQRPLATRAVRRSLRRVARRAASRVVVVQPKRLLPAGCPEIACPSPGLGPHTTRPPRGGNDQPPWAARAVERAASPSS